MFNIKSDDNARELKQKLMKMHQGKVLEDVFEGETVKNSQGQYFVVRGSEKIKINTIKKKEIKSKILADIKLVSGIGRAREYSLKNDGYKTIEHLLNHPNYSLAAEELYNQIHLESPHNLMKYISNRFSASHPHIILISCLQDVEKFLFFDIETLGLKNMPVILIGTAKISGNKIEVTQYLLKELKDERIVLDSFVRDLDDESIFITFNGRSFDLPFIKSRLRHYNIPRKIDHGQLDLLHFSRRMWGGKLPNCRLQTLERFLFKMKRMEDVPSSLVPEFYVEYLETGNVGPLVPLINHNRQDVITLARILSRLMDEIKKK